MAGCPSLFSSDEESEEARIVFGESIDGIRIGDSKAEVIRKLGEPSDFLYADFAGEVYLYQEAKSTQMEVWIYDGPALGLGVIGVSLYPPYDGRTKEGVGIGTTRSRAMNILGQPDRSDTDPPGIVYDTYTFDINQFSIGYRTDQIYSIRMTSLPQNN